MPGGYSLERIYIVNTHMYLCLNQEEYEAAKQLFSILF